MKNIIHSKISGILTLIAGIGTSKVAQSAGLCIRTIHTRYETRQPVTHDYYREIPAYQIF
jgi:hypothetical protein